MDQTNIRRSTAVNGIALNVALAELRKAGANAVADELEGSAAAVEQHALPTIPWKDEAPDWCDAREEEIWQTGYDCALSSIRSVLAESTPEARQPQAEQAAAEPVAWLVCSVNSDGSLSLEHAAAWQEAAHEHINDAITEHGIEEASSWVVRPAYTHHSPEQAQKDREDAERYRWLRDHADYAGAHIEVDAEIVGSGEIDAAIDAARAALARGEKA